MKYGRLVRVAIWFTLGFTLFALLLNYMSAVYPAIPDWLLWMFFGAVLFIALMLSIYLNVTLRVRKIQMMIEEHGMSSSLPSKSRKTVTLQTLENEVYQWTSRQSLIVEELKGREQFRREYIGNVSHELKTPIFNIQGYVLTLLDGAIEDPKVALKFLKRAAKSVERMTSLIKDMDVLSKVESGQYDIMLAPINLNNLIEDTLQAIESYAGKRSAKVSVKFNIDKKTFVFCDAPRIEQVLENLLVNAMKYSDEGKTVSLYCDEVDDKIQITIKDRGFGIPEEDLGRVFERFYRVDKARSREAGGSGLGLSIVKHIIDKHNETITVKSKEGEGTEFKFTLSKYKAN